MSRKSRFKAVGSNDAVFAGACLAAIIVFGIASHAQARPADPGTARHTSDIYGARAFASLKAVS